jgi:hypothetical protein
MDMKPLKHDDRRGLGSRPARMDYCVLVATLQASQLATATARAQSRCEGGISELSLHQSEPLAEILLGSQDWRKAVLAQGGSFNPVFAQRSNEF